MVKIFVSYRRDDAGAAAARIRDRLASAFGAANVFMDVDDLQPGQRFDQELAKALSGCKVFLAVIGAHWYDLLYARAQAGGRDYVREEIGTALARGITVIPVLIDRAVLPRPEKLPDDLRPLVFHQAYQIRHEHFGRDVDALVGALGGKTAAKATPSHQVVSWIKRGFAVLGYGFLTLVVVSNLLQGSHQSVVDAVSALCILLAGVMAFLVGPRRLRWLRVLGALFVSSLLASWITPVVNQEVTIYKAMCSPMDYEFWECEMKGGHLNPSGSERFRADRTSQTVFKFGGDLGIGSTYHFKNCTVADRLNWSCRYNDNSAIIEVTEGKYRSILLDEKDREFAKTAKPITATGQVTHLQWLELYLPYVIAAWIPARSSSRSSQERIVIVNGWWNVDYAKNSCEHATTWIKENNKRITEVGCESVTACPELMPAFNACVTDPAGGVLNFEDELLTELSANKQCNGVQLGRYAGTNAKDDDVIMKAMQKPHWTVMLDFSPGASKQSWSLQRDGVFTKGTGTAKDAAASICPIVTEQGAKPVN